MPFQFKTLRINRNGHIFSYDKYFLVGCTEDVNIYCKDEKGNTISIRNPNLNSAFSKKKFTNTINNKQSSDYRIIKNPIYTVGQEIVSFNANEVVEFSFMENNDYTILVDIDDTVISLLPAWCKWINNKYNLSVKPDEITDWDVAKFFPTLTRQQVFEPLHTNQFWETVEPIDGAIEHLQQLVEDGFKIYFCTATDYRNVQSKYENIIMKYFSFIPWSQVIVAKDKQMIDADFIIDDGVHNLENRDGIKILVSAPHNLNYDATENGMYRIDNWETIYKCIKSFTKSEYWS